LTLKGCGHTLFLYRLFYIGEPGKFPAHEVHMKSKVFVSGILFVGLLSFCGSLLAHHGSAAYSDKMITLKDATVTKFQWGNPHCIVMFDVKDEKGNVEHWASEAGSPSALSLIGWTKGSVHPGDTITVYIFQSRAGTPVGRLNRIVLPDGTILKDSQLGGNAYKGAAEKEKQQ
jgi:hypothetical protein